MNDEADQPANDRAADPDILQVTADILLQFRDDGLGVPALDRLRRQQRHVAAVTFGQRRAQKAQAHVQRFPGNVVRQKIFAHADEGPRDDALKV